MGRTPFYPATKKSSKEECGLKNCEFLSEKGINKRIFMRRVFSINSIHWKFQQI